MGEAATKPHQPLAKTTHLTLLRAMLDDIADMIGCAPPYPGVASPHTALITDGRVPRVLRNVRAV